MDSDSAEKPWVRAWPAAREGLQLIGNREGFRLLQKKIEEVIETGSVHGNTSIINCTEFHLAVEDPGKFKSASRPIRNLLVLILAASVVAFVMFVFGLGLERMWSWF